ncbi:MAG: hypothetical protein ACREM3_10395 [Candidatus Rokuibacteriota bacterium]
MSETIGLVDYFYVEAADRPGEGARMLDHLRDAGVNLLAFSGFPQGRRAQIDFVTADAGQLRAAAKAARWKLVGPKKAFLVQGDDRVGAVAEIFDKLAAAKINVTAADAVCAGSGRYGMILWVKPRDVKRAARTLGVG